MENKTITVVSQATFTLFKGLSQKDLTTKNPAEHNRLNIRPTWSHGLDEEGRVQRFDFLAGDNQCPDYIVEWESFKKMCDNGVLGIKGSYTKPTQQELDSQLAEINKISKEIGILMKEGKKEEAEAANSKTIQRHTKRNA